MDCTSLRKLYLRVNKLGGNITEFDFSPLKRLTTLDLGNNNFTGNFPRSLYSCTALTAIRFATNGLKGQILPDIVNLQSLSFISVSNNSLENVTGALSILTGCKSLTTVILTKNFLHEPMPRDWVLADPNGFQKLQLSNLPPAIYLYNNSLSGPIPREIGQLKSIHVLELNHNNFSGTIPDEISSLSNLEILDLSNNEFTGVIPASLKNLHFLSFFSVAYNNLQGMIPAGGQFDTFPDSSYVGNPGLCGRPLSDCSNQSGSSGQEGRSRRSNRKLVLGLATLANGTKLAVKKLSGDMGLMEKEFKAEVEVLSNARHENLVTLQGYCIHEGSRLLIYSYMENGSLDYWLHEKSDGPAHLSWPMRLKIAQGASRGVAYMHQICQPHIVHRDIKSSNILLDGKFEAHVADFGLSRLILPYHTHVTTELVGTLGYIPPEYAHSWVATLRGDMYSFGVVMLELLTGKRPVEITKPKESRELVGWVQEMRKEGKQNEIFDPLLQGKGFEDQMVQVLDVACLCVSSNPFKRPTIQDVVDWLENVGQ
ncbi:hypothetical protein CRG98_029196 [Punica granatum]|uniref:non-specific serine/threonine protein kinase n=1 Tax=Punica granatum TaxID=22663 RepID=A0A2I0J3Y6_PUNGR|nr:hypothetical protein CRG98_029196 [Punica granatum]